MRPDAATDELGVTPPDKAIPLPPTPPSSAKRPSPAVITVLQTFQLHREGRLSLWTKIQLSPEQYSELWRQLAEDTQLCGYVENKLRYDFDPGNQLLIIRMTTATHDVFIAKVVKDILLQLNTISHDLTSKEAKTLIQQIEWQNTSRILLIDEPGVEGDETDRRYSRRCPDAHFRHSSTKYSQIVFEVSYSQKERDLPYLAENYILGSRGSIGVVVSFDLEYRGSKATISMWRPKIWVDSDGTKHLEVDRVIHQEPFRSTDGTPTSGSLSLKIRDFALPEVCRDVPVPVLETPISIPYTQLTEYLKDAEATEDQVNTGTGHTLLPVDEKLIVHKRKRTPGEEFDSDDDAEIVKRESRRARKTDKEDEDWVE